MTDRQASIFQKIYYKFRLDKWVGRVSSVFSDAFGKPITILNEMETVQRITDNALSVARFGDGELHIAQEGCAIGFQKADKELQHRLREILDCRFDQSKICICLPSCINDVRWMTNDAQQVWNNDLKYNRYFWRKMINMNNVFGDTQFTRPYIDYKDRSGAKTRFERIKKLWNNRDLLIVEGEKSKLGVGNDLFLSANSIKRILCPAQDAFDKYNEILKAVKRFDNNYLVLIALGPTATVLAYDLCNSGYQAIDIGHIDIEYEWFLSGTSKKSAVQGKWTNESDNKCINSDLVGNEYEKQIIERIIL